MKRASYNLTLMSMHYSSSITTAYFKSLGIVNTEQILTYCDAYRNAVPFWSVYHLTAKRTSDVPGTCGSF